MSWKATLESDYSQLTNSQLRPYLARRKIKLPSKFAMYVYGSTIASVWIEILAFSFYATTLYLLIYFLHWVSNCVVTPTPLVLWGKYFLKE